MYRNKIQESVFSYRQPENPSFFAKNKEELECMKKYDFPMERKTMKKKTETIEIKKKMDLISSANGENEPNTFSSSPFTSFMNHLEKRIHVYFVEEPMILHSSP